MTGMAFPAAALLYWTMEALSVRNALAGQRA
jgi:hypothetical protein